MIRPLSTVALAALLALAPFSSTRAVAAERKVITENPKAASDSFQKLLTKEKFAEIEKLLADLRAQKTRASDGLWALSGIYNDAHIAGKDVVDADFEAELALMRKWQAAIPDSITRPVVEAEILTKYAWKARGGGYAPTVTDNGWKLFNERIASARQILDEATSLPARCPHWYAVMQTIATAQGWPRSDYDRLFAEAIQREPSYETYYFKKAHYLLTRWHGRPGEAVAFLDESLSLHPAGAEIYARIAWSQIHLFGGDFFKESGYSWEKTQAGFEALISRHPAGKNIQAYAFFACRMKDRELAKKLFEQNADAAPYLPVWRTRAYFEQCKRWALWEKKASTALPPVEMPKPSF
jgi:hypothetical protein